MSRFLYKTSPQQGGLRVSGPPPGQDADGGARSNGRGFPAASARLPNPHSAATTISTAAPATASATIGAASQFGRYSYAVYGLTSGGYRTVSYRFNCSLTLWALNESSNQLTQ
ncbi:hypothetical protein PoB_002210700 [Plakobranchus ocellatus]|uniref:Uncharacterized protein n=1 Tax=Plakobranchus ocellatus TaxID=259542 RepID=A0AAV3ZM53_9GAST|nr:hypothetical protein PoB_002210700 [Plakobranchus ocellatus]